MNGIPVPESLLAGPGPVAVEVVALLEFEGELWTVVVLLLSLRLVRLSQGWASWDTGVGRPCLPPT